MEARAVPSHRCSERPRASWGQKPKPASAGPRGSARLRSSPLLSQRWVREPSGQNPGDPGSCLSDSGPGLLLRRLPGPGRGPSLLDWDLRPLLGLGPLWHRVPRLPMPSLSWTGRSHWSSPLPLQPMAAEAQLPAVVSGWAPPVSVSVSESVSESQRQRQRGFRGPGPAQAKAALPSRGRGEPPSAPAAPQPRAQAPSEQLPLAPPRHCGHQGGPRLHFLCPTGRAPGPWASSRCPGPVSGAPTAPPGPGPRFPPLPRRSSGQTSPGHSPRSPTAGPCHSSPGRDSPEFAGLAEPFLWMAVLHQKWQPALPPTPQKSSPSALCSEKKKKKKKAKSKKRKRTQKNRKGAKERKREARPSPVQLGKSKAAHHRGHLRGLHLQGWHSTSCGSFALWGPPSLPAFTTRKP